MVPFLDRRGGAGVRPDHPVEDSLLRRGLLVLGDVPGGGRLVDLLELTADGGRIVQLLLDLILDDFTEPQDGPDRCNRQREDGRDQPTAQSSGARFITKSYAAIGPSRSISARPSHSCARERTMSSRSPCRDNSMSTATCAASSSCVG